MREIVFFIFALCVLGALLLLSYKTKLKRYDTVFAVTLLALVAFYLFQYGNLSSFNLKALSAEASFVSQKKEQVTADAQAIGAVKSQIEDLLAKSRASQQEIEHTESEILALKKQLVETTAMASPPTLQLTGREVKTVESGYVITAQFTPSKNEPLGEINFIATIDDNSGARILDFRPTLGGGAFLSGKNSKKISDDGKQARLVYSLVSAGKPTFDLSVSGKPRVKIEGNFLKEAVVLTVE
jgi:Ca2+/Na+ antiporter